MSRLTAASAAALQPGEVLKDHVVKGLELRAKARGAAWFLYYRAQDGSQRRPRLGAYPALSVDKARDVAKEWHLRIARGEDPSAEKAALRAAPRLSDLWEMYELQHVSSEVKESTADLYRLYWRVHIAPALGDWRVADIKPYDVRSFLDKLPSTTSNRVRAVLFALFKFASLPSVALMTSDANPVRETKKKRERLRRVHITREEFQAVGKAMDAHSKIEPRKVAAILCMLLAGSRVTEMARARWANFDGTNRRLILSEHKTDRTGDDRIIRLPLQAVQIIEGLPRDKSGFIFGDIDRYDVRRIWLKISDAAGCPHVRLQDLRRTFASTSRTVGYSQSQTGGLLGHRQGQTTDRYAFLFDDAAHDMTQTVGDEIYKRLSGPVE